MAAASFRETSGRTCGRKGRARVSSRGGGTRAQDRLSLSLRGGGERRARREGGGGRRRTGGREGEDGEERGKGSMGQEGGQGESTALRFGPSLSGERSGAGPQGQGQTGWWFSFVGQRSAACLGFGS